MLLYLICDYGHKGHDKRKEEEMKIRSILGLAIGLVITTAVAAAEITGAGATFPFPIYAKWANDYKEKTGTSVNYQSVGSGAGIKQIKSKTVVFGASDKPLTAEELKEAGLIQWPQIIGGIVPIINVKGIESDKLVLSGEVLARIYLKEITNWNDPAIKALNKGTNLPDLPIIVAYRSDGSGTTFNFTHYLSEVSKTWKEKIGSGTAVEWPVGLGAKGNEGVANLVKITNGAIGYVEYAYAKQNEIAHAKMINKNGKTVSPSIKAFQAAAAGADWANAPGFGLILNNQPGDEAWPMTSASYILIYKDPADKEGTAETIKFFRYAFANGDAEAEKLDFVPIPDQVVALVEKLWSTVVLK